MNMLRNLLVTFSLLFIPAVALAEEAKTCVTVENLNQSITESNTTDERKIQAIRLEGDNFTAFLAVISNRFGKPPHPVESVMVLQRGESVILVFFGPDGCANVRATIPESVLIGILREASL